MNSTITAEMVEIADLRTELADQTATASRMWDTIRRAAIACQDPGKTKEEIYDILMGIK